MKVDKYDIYWLEMQFQQDFLMDNPRTKSRPCIVKEVYEDTVVVMAMITSKKHKDQYVVRDWKEAGLQKPSYINYNNVQEFKLSDLKEYIGHLSDFDIQRIKSQRWDESLIDTVNENSNPNRRSKIRKSYKNNNPEREINKMKSTGIIRRIDDLGRIAIPKEIRRPYGINGGDPIEIYADKKGIIELRKYDPNAEEDSAPSSYRKDHTERELKESMDEKSKKEYLEEYLGVYVTESGYDENVFETDDGEEWLVVDEDEADERVRDYIEDSVWAFNPDFILEHMRGYDDIPMEDEEAIKKALETVQEKLSERANPLILAIIEDFDEFVEDAVNADGRGHFISSDDGDEIELADDKGYIQFYAYRQN